MGNLIEDLTSFLVIVCICAGGLLVAAIGSCQAEEPTKEKPSLLKRVFGSGEKEEPTKQVVEPGAAEPIPTKVYGEPKASWFAFPNWSFWLSAAVAFLLLLMFGEYEDYEGEYRSWKLGGNLAAGILCASLLWSNREPLWDLWNRFGWQGVVGVFLIVLLAGLLNFWIRWEMKTMQALDTIKEREAQVIAAKDLRDAQGNLWLEMQYDPKALKQRDEYFESHGWSLDLPRRSEHKALLTKWVCLGVVSLPGLLLTNGAQFFGLSVYEAFGWLADATTRRHERKIKRA